MTVKTKEEMKEIKISPKVKISTPKAFSGQEQTLTDEELTVKDGKGGFKDETVEGSFRLFALPEGAFDLTTAKITAKGTTKPVAKQDYTGREIRPEIDVLAKQKGSSQYTKVPSENVIISFRDNVRRGKATIIVTGDNVKAFGNRTGNFTIGIKSFKDILAIVFER